MGQKACKAVAVEDKTIHPSRVFEHKPGRSKISDMTQFLCHFVFSREEDLQHVRAVVRFVQESSLHDKAQHLFIGHALVRLFC